MVESANIRRCVLVSGGRDCSPIQHCTAAIAVNRAVAWLVLVLMTGSACSASGVVGASVRAKPGDGLSVAFVGDVPLSSSSGYEKGIVSCVSEAVRKDLASLNVVPSHVLLKALFPSASVRADALDPLSLMLLRDDPVAWERLRRAGIRYVIALSGGSTTVDAENVNAAPIAAGGVWTRRSSYSADIYDVASGRVTGTASASADAGGGVGIGIIPPFLYVVPTFTHSRACARLGAVVVEALGGPAAPQK